MRIEFTHYLLLILLFLSIAIMPTQSHAQAAGDPDYGKDDSCFQSPDGGANMIKKTLYISASGSIAGAASAALLAEANDGAASELAMFSGAAGAVGSGGVSVLAAQIIIDGFVLNRNDVMTDEDCTKPLDTISFCYDPIYGPGVGYRASSTSAVLFDGTQDCDEETQKNWKDGDEKWVNGAKFRAKYDADKLCIQLHSGAAGWITMGCRWRYPPTPEVLQTKCYIGVSCIDGVREISKGILPLSSMVVQCFKETLNNIFVDKTKCAEAGNQINMYVNFQNAVRKAITAALTLYVIFFGIRVALGQQIPGKGEIFIFILKMTLVVYFALGDGIQDWLYPAFNSAATSLSQIFFSAGGTQTLCLYKPEDYAGGADLSLWDALDCRIGYYLGFYNIAAPTYTGTVQASSLLMAPAIFAFFIPLLFSLQIVTALAILLFGVLFLSIVVFVVHTYLVALIGITIVMYLAPLMVPMALFKFTRGFFDGWLKILATFAIQPVILFAFLATMLTVFDRIYYNTCPFKSTDITISYPQKDEHGLYVAGRAFSRPVPLFYMDEEKINAFTNAEEKAACTDTMGYALFKLQKKTVELNLIFITVRFPYELSDIKFVTKGILPLLLFCFLFYYFATVFLADIAGDLMGTFTVGTSIFTLGPDNIARRIASGIVGKKEAKQQPRKK